MTPTNVKKNRCTSYRAQPRSARVDVAYLRSVISATKWINPLQILPVSRSLLVPLQGKNTPSPDTSTPLRNLPVSTFNPAALYKVFCDRAACLSRANASGRAPNWCSEEADWVDTILSQPTHLRESTDWLNRVDIQELTYLAGESNTTPA